MKFALKQIVRIEDGTEVGTVIGRSEYANGAPPSYLLRYVSAAGSVVEQWWSEDALVAF
jgi:hypothetical protein